MTTTEVYMELPSYPTMSEEEWGEYNETHGPDCTEEPACPLHFEDETGVMCALWLIYDFEDVSFSEICGRVCILRQRLLQSSPTKAKGDEK